MNNDFIAIGDTVVDEFIKLKEAHINCSISHDDCTISMKWGDKIPYESSTLISAVGNSANAAVSASRLGLSSAFISNLGNDDYGKKSLEVFKNERVDTKYIKINDDIQTNHHFVLWYEAERTILIRHEKYNYSLPIDLLPPKWIYLSSLGEHSEAFHDEIIEWLSKNKETKLAFQPGTFQMSMGKDRLAELYKITEVVACNKEEAERILDIGETDIKILLEKMHALGPKIVIITDGTNGSYSYDGENMLKVPMYPDERDPVDRTGAGDATTSTIVSALALGIPLEEALLWGPINAMSVVQEIGAQKGLLSRAEIEHYLSIAPENYKVEKL